MKLKFSLCSRLSAESTYKVRWPNVFFNFSMEINQFWYLYSLVITRNLLLDSAIFGRRSVIKPCIKIFTVGHECWCIERWSFNFGFWVWVNFIISGGTLAHKREPEIWIIDVADRWEISIFAEAFCELTSLNFTTCADWLVIWAFNVLSFHRTSHATINRFFTINLCDLVFGSTTSTIFLWFYLKIRHVFFNLFRFNIFLFVWK